MTEYSYDEDLNENKFFQELKNKYKHLLDQAPTENWIICVPKNSSVENIILTKEDILYHILLPNEDKYRTLNGSEVKVLNSVIISKNDSLVSKTRILFEETFYTENLKKYQVWCVECLLNQIKSRFSNTCHSVLTLRDCIDFLWQETSGKEILELLDLSINHFLFQHNNFHELSLQVQKDLVNNLYTQCFNIALADSKIEQNISKHKHNLNISIESYVQHNLYKTLLNGISIHTACEDSNFNKIVRNLSHIHLRDLNIKPDLYDTITYAKHQLAKINGFSTILGKLSCLRHTITEISGYKSNFVLSADELLPILVFVILKSSVPNWIANLYFLKEFQFYLSTFEENKFYITTLEAAIEYIKSGIVLSDHISDNKNILCYFFEQIRLGNLSEVKVILDKNASNVEFESKTIDLCHPLCSCDKCENLLLQITTNVSLSMCSTNEKGQSALHIACMYGKPKIVELLLKYELNLNRTDFSGATPLHYAAMKGHQNVLLLLLHSGADINAEDNEKNTPLHFSCNNGQVTCVKALLYFSENKKGLININCTNLFGDTPLHNASRWGFKSIVHILLEHGADPNLENKLRKKPCDYALNLKIYNIILDAQTTNLNEYKKNLSEEYDFVEENFDTSDPNLQNYSSTKSSSTRSDEMSLDYDFEQSNPEKPMKPCSPREMKKAELLLRAVTYDDLPMLCYYLGLPVPLNSSKNDSSTLCHPLCNCEKCETVYVNNTEFENKQNINVCNSEGYTALHVASLHGQVDIVKLLLSNGALPNVMTNKGMTALHLACQTERLEIVKLLLDCDGIKVNLQDYKGNSALHFACHSRDIQIIKLLLKKGADLNITNGNGKTPLDEADGRSLNFIKNFES